MWSEELAVAECDRRCVVVFSLYAVLCLCPLALMSVFWMV